MDKDERKVKLKTIIGDLLMNNCELISDGTHIRFKAKPKDVISIFDNYIDVIESSNLHIGKHTIIGNFSFNCDKFKVSTFTNGIKIESREYIQCNNFSTYVELNKVSEIEINISCESILTFEFDYPNTEFPEMYSFRDDQI